MAKDAVSGSFDYAPIIHNKRNGIAALRSGRQGFMVWLSRLQRDDFIW